MCGNQKMVSKIEELQAAALLFVLFSFFLHIFQILK